MEIINMYNKETKISDATNSLKDCLDKNRGEDFSCINFSLLGVAGSSFADINLSNSSFIGVSLYGSDFSAANLSFVKFKGADLQYANLCGSVVFHTDFSGCSLKDTKIEGIKEYSENHHIFFELISRSTPEFFNVNEWAIIGKLILHVRENNPRGWPGGYISAGFNLIKIEEIFKDHILSVFCKLAEIGFDEYKNKYEEILYTGNVK